MSGWGIVAAGLAGGANAVGDITKGMIDQDRRLQSAQAIADMEELKAKRLAEFNAGVTRQSNKDTMADTFAFNNDAGNVATANATAASRALAAGESARAVKKADLSDTGLIDLDRQKQADDAKAKHKIDVEQTIADSGNQSLLRAMADLTNADPSKRAEINLKNAHANEANVRAGYLKSGGANAGKAEKMDEADKIEYQNLFGQVKTELGNLSKFEAEGLPLDKDGKPTPQYALVKNNAARAQRSLLAFQMRKGLLDPADMAKAAISGETDSAKIGTAIAQSYELGGSAFGDKFFATVRESGALERNAERSASQTAEKESKQSGVVGGSSAPAYVAPADSPVGKMRAMNDAAIAERQQADKALQQRAMEAFKALPQGDRKAAWRLQSGPLFDALPAEQKRVVSNLVNGR